MIHAVSSSNLCFYIFRKPNILSNHNDDGGMLFHKSLANCVCLCRRFRFMVALDDVNFLSVEEVSGQEIARGDALVVLKTVRCYSSCDNIFDADCLRVHEIVATLCGGIRGQKGGSGIRC